MSRYHPAKRLPNFVHVSKIFWDAEEKDPKTGVITKMKMTQHCTAVAGRNKEKRAARADEAARDLMLTARRFRQRQGEARV